MVLFRPLWTHPVFFLCFQIIRCAERIPGFLNRQFILLLSTLGVPDIVFQKLQDAVVLRMQDVTLNREVSHDVLPFRCSDNFRRVIHTQETARFYLSFCTHSAHILITSCS